MCDDPDEVFTCLYWNPAQVITRTDSTPEAPAQKRCSHLKTYWMVDLGLTEKTGEENAWGNNKLEANFTIKAGRVVCDLNGLTSTPLAM